MAHRAYARALAGLHGAARVDIDRAREQSQASTATAPEGQAASPPLPQWVDVIEAFCRYDNPELGQLANKATSWKQLALLLSYIHLENSRYSLVGIESGQRIHDEAPYCFRVVDGLSDSALGLKHLFTVSAPELLTQVIKEKFARLPGLPEDIRTAVRPGKTRGAGLLARLFSSGKKEKASLGRAALVAKLLKAGRPEQDSAEPSWAVLGRMIEEVTFAQIYRRAHFLKKFLNVESESFVQEAVKDIPDHPYLAFIRTFAIPDGQRRQETQKLLRQFQVIDADVQLTPLIDATGRLEKPGANQGYAVWRKMEQNMDDIARDLTLRCRRLGGKRLLDAAHRLIKVSPHSGDAAAILIESDWDFAKGKVSQWEKTLSYHPKVIEQLAKRYYSKGDSYRAVK